MSSRCNVDSFSNRRGVEGQADKFVNADREDDEGL